MDKRPENRARRGLRGTFGPSRTQTRTVGPGPTRRDALALGIAALAASTLPAAADLGDFTKIYAETTKGATPKTGRVKLTMPELAENGNSVSTLIEVESPMTAADHVKTISLLSEKNPQTLVFRVHLGPRSGRARVATNVRLADTQRVVCIAEMSDGSLWQGETRVLVTLAACIDGG